MIRSGLGKGSSGLSPGRLTPYVAAEHPDGVFLVPTRAHKKFFIRGEPKDARVFERAVERKRLTDVLVC